jgi:hypothetical protein
VTALQTAFHAQAAACQALGSPFMHRLCTLLAENWPSGSSLADACSAFSGDLGPSGVSLPLRIAGGLHALRLQGDANLAELYPPNLPDDTRFRTGVLDTLRRHEPFLTDWIRNPPQTNEVRRSAVLIAAARLAVERFGLPVRLSELGASAGLNLMWDRFALAGPDWRLGPDSAPVSLAPDWDGPPPTDAVPVIAERRGVDLSPLDPSDPEDLLRLTAFIWPDQPQRLTMTRAAAAAGSAPVDRGDAVDWLAERLPAQPSGQLHLIQNTIAWQYFSTEAQTRGRALIEDAGAQATETRPLAWTQLENDGDPHGLGGAAISLQLWPGGEVRSLGRADFHGRWVTWRPENTDAKLD